MSTSPSKKTSQKSQRKKKDTTTYNEWLSSIEMLDIHVSWMHAEIEGQATVRDKWATLDLPLTQTLRHAIDNKNHTLHFRHKIHGRAELDKEIFVDIGVEYELHFKTTLKTTPKFVKTFSEYTLGLITRPYIREYLTSSLVRIGLPGDLLPLAVFEQAQESESESTSEP